MRTLPGWFWSSLSQTSPRSNIMITMPIIQITWRQREWGHRQVGSTANSLETRSSCSRSSMKIINYHSLYRKELEKSIVRARIETTTFQWSCEHEVWDINCMISKQHISNLSAKSPRLEAKWWPGTILISGTEPSFTNVFVDSAGEGFLIRIHFSSLKNYLFVTQFSDKNMRLLCLYILCLLLLWKILQERAFPCD